MSADGTAPSFEALLKGKTIRAADLFCGAGGTSTGAMRAIRELGGKMDLVAVNHWDTAIATHTRMHPEARHMCADLEHVRPRQAVPGGVLDLLMASPTCTYYSRARGGRPVHDQQRMDPWHVVRWCTDLRVHRLLVENVPEMMDWGPCDIRTGKPIQHRKGEYFNAWLNAVKAIFKKVDYRVLNCANFGDPTTRERLFVIANNVGPLRWPEPSHVKGGSRDLLGARLTWRSAKDDVIDWSLRGKSVFNRKKPLKPNTIRRILAGAKRYGWPAAHVAALQALLDEQVPMLDVLAEEASPFLLTLRGTSPAQVDASAGPVTGPIPTVTAGGGHVGLVMAAGATGAARQTGEPVPSIVGTASQHFIEPLLVSKHGGPGNTARSASEPLFAVDTGGAGSVATPLLMGVGSSNAAKPVSEPTPTITTGGGSAVKRPGNARPQLIEPILVSRNNAERGRLARPVSEPLQTSTTCGAGYVAEPILMRAGHGGDALKNPGAHVMKPGAPLPAQTGGGEFSVAQPVVAPYYGGGSGLTAQPVTEPVPAVTTKARFGMAEPLLLRAAHGDSDGRNPGSRMLDSGAPLPAQTGSNEFGVAEAVILPVTHQGGEQRVRSVSEPLPTVTGANRGELGVADAIIMRGNVGTGRERDMRPATEPLQTVTCSESLAMSAPFIVPNFGEAPGQEPRTHGIDEPLPTVTAQGHMQIAAPVAEGYRIDILYRMLHWRELARAMSFDADGEVYDFAGNATEITKQIGNAVPGRTAKALIRALLGAA